ncbi:T9SS type A sorting domain-containing protein, partial [bacterium]|nr:T9SS type A sorting domain-containing protein [bacterium]
MPYQWGWPRLMQGWPTLYGHTATIADLDGNGDLEVQLSNIANYFYVWQHDGAFYPGYPRNPLYITLPTDPPSDVNWVSTAAVETAAMGDIDGDGGNEYVYGCGIGYLCVYGPSGPMDGFPWLLDTALFSGVPALVDLDGIEGDEIVINTYDYFDGFPQNDPQVHVYYPDHSEMAGWPKHTGRRCQSSPAVGDLDGDGVPEIVIGCESTSSGPGQIFAWHADGSPVTGYPITGLFSVNSTPTIADIDGDTLQEVIIRVKFQDSTTNGVYVFDHQGQIKPGFPAPVSSGHPDGACAVGDIDGDGDLEIAFGSIEAVDLGRVYAWHHDGTPVAGFPQLVGATWVDGSVAMGDVSGDGLPDIVATTNGVSGDPGHVVAFDYQGNMVAEFPLFPDPGDQFTSMECTPTVLDVDGDGDIEIFATDWENKVYAWDTPGIVSEYPCWPSLKFGPHRTGCRATEPDPEPPNASPQPSAKVNRFELLDPYPNPFNSSVMLPFTLSHSARAVLKVYDVLGRLVAETDLGMLEAGQHRHLLDGRHFSSGIYICQLEANEMTASRKVALLK